MLLLTLLGISKSVPSVPADPSGSWFILSATSVETSLPFQQVTPFYDASSGRTTLYACSGLDTSYSGPSNGNYIATMDLTDPTTVSFISASGGA